VSGFPGDPPTVAGLDEVYAEHVATWSLYALPSTTLWFWGTELSWAKVHPVFELHGWEPRGIHTWNKGIGHIAGNVNGETIRKLPVVTEVCAQYTRRVRLWTGDGQRLDIQRWMRAEWLRSGLPLNKTNEAAGVANAATRKYFTADHLWYFAPPQIMVRIARYANEHGLPTDKPYFSLDGRTRLRAGAWAALRAKWQHIHGITNVWDEPAVRGEERLRDEVGVVIHTNQKPMRLMELNVRSCSDAGDIVWEPFGGLCTASTAAMRLGRRAYCSEIDPTVYEAAAARLTEADRPSSTR
jgi:site-specific DNA-methyltransferase (adenine-specific)